MIQPNTMMSNNESIPISFPKCRKNGTYMKFSHLWGSFEDADWYICMTCNSMYLIERCHSQEENIQKKQKRK